MARTTSPLSALALLLAAGCGDGGETEPGSGGAGGGPPAECTFDDTFDLASCPASYPPWQCEVYVDGEVARSGEGWSWQSAVKTVQEGIDLAHCGALEQGICAQWQVWVKAGRYHVYQSCRYDTLRLRPQVAVHGGFRGDEERPGDRDGVSETILDGASESDPNVYVYHVAYGSDDALLERVTIRGGRAEHPTEDVHMRGGGMLNLASAPWVSEVVFRDNYALFNGGAMYNQDGSPTIVDCRFDSNESGAYGGGVSNNRDADTLILSSTFVNNQAVNGGGVNNYKNRAEFHDCLFEGNVADWGGALLTYGGDNLVEGCSFVGNSATNGGAVLNEAQGDVTLRNCELEENSAKNLGGAFYGIGGHSSLSGTTFRSNTAPFGGALLLWEGEHELSSNRLELNGASHYGGAALVLDASVDARDCTFVSNGAWAGAAMSFWGNGELIVQRSVFQDNAAGYYGGALDLGGGASATLESCLLFGNSAVRGAAIQAGGSGPMPPATQLTLLYCTLANNHAEEAGGAVDRAPELFIRGSILWGDAPEELAGDLATSIVDSDVSGDAGGSGNFSLDPLFVDATSGDFRLAAGSPCIDASDGALAPATDLDGNPRVDDPQAPDAPGCASPCADLGAYERQP